MLTKKDRIKKIARLRMDYANTPYASERDEILDRILMLQELPAEFPKPEPSDELNEDIGEM